MYMGVSCEVKRKAVNCKQMFMEKKVMPLCYLQDHFYSDTMISKDFKCTISG